MLRPSRKNSVLFNKCNKGKWSHGFFFVFFFLPCVSSCGKMQNKKRAGILARVEKLIQLNWLPYAVAQKRTRKSCCKGVNEAKIFCSDTPVSNNGKVTFGVLFILFIYFFFFNGSCTFSQ